MKSLVLKANQTLKKNRRNNKGFTLVELIIVIAIIAVLTAVLAPQYLKYVNQSKVAADDNTAATLLNEVQVAMVEVGMEAGADALTAGGSITVSNTAVTLSTSPAFSSDVKDALDKTDPNWQQVRTEQKDKTFTIELTANGATLTKTW